MTSIDFVNPKVGSTSDPVNSWYRYYAGYSASFVEDALARFKTDGCRALDPWNGTGTTTVIAANERVNAIGFDINPALVVIARARLLGAGVWASIQPLGSDVVAHTAPVYWPEEPFDFWFSRETSAWLRGLQQSVHRLLVDSNTSTQPVYVSSSEMSTLAAFFYTVLFRTVRVLIAPRAGTNPTWWKRVPDSDRLSLPQKTILSIFELSASELASGLHRDNFDAGLDVRADLGDSRNLPVADRSIDLAIGSPPYCTRIDYGVATRPELAVLGATEADIKELRNQMVGTPTMTGDWGEPNHWGPTSVKFLANVAAHSSKASGGYYTNYFRQYYAGMWASLGELRRTIKMGGVALLVVQDNYYKEIHNDTPGILSEMALARGFHSAGRQDFPVVRNRASMNPRSRQYRSNAAAVESVLILS